MCRAGREKTIQAILKIRLSRTDGEMRKPLPYTSVIEHANTRGKDTRKAQRTVTVTGRCFPLAVKANEKRPLGLEATGGYRQPLYS